MRIVDAPRFQGPMTDSITRASADLRLPTGEVVTLGHGAIIGRLWSADLPLNDARISEAHAMVSLRGRDLRLLALRGRFTVKDRVQSNVVLEPGMSVAFARGLEVVVEAVRVPDRVLALEADGVAPQVLDGVSSVFGGTRPRVMAGWHAEASDWVWPTGAGWMRHGTGEAHPVDVGDAWDVDGVSFRAVVRRVEGANATRRELGYDAPLVLTARYDTVHIARKGEGVVVITGHVARVISELAAAEAPIAWEVLAEQLWPDADRGLQRRRWDMLLLRFRHKLRDHMLRGDLLRADGSGLIELVLGPDDRLVDAT